MWIRRICLTCCLAAVWSLRAEAGDLPEGFVYLRDVVPDITQDMRYATRRNFMRKRLPGYGAGECILTEAAAKALGKVQSAAVRQNYTLVVFDCYRPQSAVDAMVAWVSRGHETDPDYYPSVARSDLIRQGYIGAKSSHARGSTVDVALDLLSGEQAGALHVCSRRDRGTLDFGTPFDCFDPASKTASNAVPETAQHHRRTLLDLMRQGGFKNYSGEWWHFTLQGEPFPTRSFDFAITRR
ncbi:M15 family metallopeptidase [Roseibium sediminicola]|uniref:D-alanyl-D-alanine dipeptidase n=1 Tax=Roseibium sediminicola TaxID=2933272 RepID=A0ABT0GSK2_9HYPH|nr:M15 family metallopeptidase [Roseibium sp. CAU 1639]MCK7612421.1 M15 family metallopeptidase [Roseibium sp. CAU 1639]